MSDSLRASSPSSRRIGGVNDNKQNRAAKACNCKKSNCLKLYCECFANGVYCQLGKCNCVSCFNNLENNFARSQAVESTLERNPNSFRSKMFINDKSNDKAVKNTSNKLHKGCHCKKSNCLKKYCECFQAGIVCTDRCRCLSCKNYKGSAKRKEATAKVEQKERQAILEMQQNQHHHAQPQHALSDAENIAVQQQKKCSNSIDTEIGLENNNTPDDTRFTFLDKSKIQSTARMLASKSRELIEDCSSSKRKAGDSDVDIKKEGEETEDRGGTSYNSQVKKIKQDLLGCFSENLRELIVQSLASKISESSNLHSDLITGTESDNGEERKETIDK